MDEGGRQHIEWLAQNSIFGKLAKMVCRGRQCLSWADEPVDVVMSLKIQLAEFCRSELGPVARPNVGQLGLDCADGL